MLIRTLTGGCLVAAVVGLGASQTLAGSYSFQPNDGSGNPADLWDLDHYEYYKWGINWSVPAGEEIYEAKLFFDNIRNWDSSPNVLYGQLLASNPTGTTRFTNENQPNDTSGGNALAGDGIQLFQWNNLPTTAQDLTYVFDAAELASLTSYAADGKIGLGFDPDCHYWNDGVTFSIKTRPKSENPPPSNNAVPEPITAAMGAVALGALTLGCRRRTR